MNSPLLLSTGPLTFASGDYREIPDTTRLQNPFRTAMWIDEIRFNFSSDTASAVLPLQARGVRVGLHLGRMPLTNNPVSIDAFGRVLTQRTPINTWRLPKPLYVPSGETIVPRIWNTSLSPIDATIEIVYVGRSIPKGEQEPKSIFVPYVAAYNAPIVNVGDPYSVVQSTEADLVNPFNETLHVQRFVGAYFAAGGLSLPGQNIYNNTLIRAVDSEGTIMVKDATIFSSLFNFSTQVWNVNTRLKPKGFYLFEVARDLSAIPFVGADPTYPIISMVGYREVALR